jgi:hypothetical protein
LVRLVQGGHFLHTFSGEIRRNYPNNPSSFPVSTELFLAGYIFDLNFTPQAAQVKPPV